jgi:hypothetical protein
MDALTEPASPRIRAVRTAAASFDLTQAVTTPGPIATTPNRTSDPAPTSSTPRPSIICEEDIDVDWGASQEIEQDALSREELRTRGWIDEPQFGMEGW